MAEHICRIGGPVHKFETDFIDYIEDKNKANCAMIDACIYDNDGTMWGAQTSQDLNKVKSLIDKDAHHGVCNCSYKMRYITPENVSTFISNIEKAMANKLLKPKMGDCDLFAVSSVKKFLEGNGCVPFDAFSLMGNPGADIPKGASSNSGTLSFPPLR